MSNQILKMSKDTVKWESTNKILNKIIKSMVIINGHQNLASKKGVCIQWTVL